MDHAAYNTERVCLEDRKAEEVRLLVSVRDADEAREACQGGADIIDVKDPSRGPLGAAEDAVIEEIAHLTSDRPVTAALGELSEEVTLPIGPTAVKAGLAGWIGKPWRTELAALMRRLRDGQQLVAVAYADWRQCAAPSPTDVLDFAGEQGLKWLLLDTYSKQESNLLTTIPCDEITHLLQLCRSQGLQTALAGSLRLGQICAAAALGPDLVAVRGAVCRGGRQGRVASQLVAAAKKEVELATNALARHDLA